jgi:ribonuclease T2
MRFGKNWADAEKVISVPMCAFLMVFLSVCPPSAPAMPSNTPGNFDFYLLTLSWTPEFCAENPSNSECASPESAVMVHGLWPEWKNGKWPQFCSHATGPANPSQYADLIPGEIISHEWQKHGTCSGLPANGYFDLIRRIRASIQLPHDLQSPTAAETTSPAALKAELAASNPSLAAGDVVIVCTAKAFLSEIEICLDKNGVPINCPVPPSCQQPSITVLGPSSQPGT